MKTTDLLIIGGAAVLMASKGPLISVEFSPSLYGTSSGIASGYSPPMAQDQNNIFGYLGQVAWNAGKTVFGAII